MRTLFIALTLVLMASACSTSLIITKASTFTKKQKHLIKKGTRSDPMPVFIITKQSDSILLRQKSAPINVNRNKELIGLFAQKLEATMVAEQGVGIAAPQVGILKQMICVQRFDKEGFPNEIFINPTITSYSEKKQPCLEGCLSIPGRSDTTQIRALTIQLEYDILNGEHIKESVTGFTAVIFQHEIDHLNGILYIDHLKQEMEMND